MQVEIDSHIVRTFWALYQRISKSIHVLAIIEMHLKISVFTIFLGSETCRLRANPIHVVILVTMSSIQIYNLLLEMIVQIDIIQSCLSTIEYEQISVVSIVHLIVGLSSLFLNEIKILCHRKILNSKHICIVA